MLPSTPAQEPLCQHPLVQRPPAACELVLATASANAGAIATALVGWVMQSVLQILPTPALRMVVSASSANSAWVTATSTLVAPAAAGACAARATVLAGAGHVIQQHRSAILRRYVRQRDFHAAITVPDLAADRVVKAMPCGGMGDPLS